MISNENVTSRTRRIAIWYKFDKQLVELPKFAPIHLPTDLMPADLFTKVLAAEKFALARELVGIVDMAEAMGRVKEPGEPGRGV
jgi:hypothetical protein